MQIDLEKFAARAGMDNLLSARSSLSRIKSTFKQLRKEEDDAKDQDSDSGDGNGNIDDQSKAKAAPAVAKDAKKAAVPRKRKAADKATDVDDDGNDVEDEGPVKKKAKRVRRVDNATGARKQGRKDKE